MTLANSIAPVADAAVGLAVVVEPPLSMPLLRRCWGVVEGVKVLVVTTLFESKKNWTGSRDRERERARGT